jgi:hypothetical protein
MKSKILGLLAVGLLAGPMAANAEPVIWELNGTVTDASGTLGDLLDKTFVVFMGFDTDAAIIRTDTGGRFAPGARYTYDPSSLYFDVSFAGGDFVRYTPDLSRGAFIIQRDNSGDLATLTGEGPQIDGYGFNTGYVGFAARGPSPLDIVNGPGLPTDPDPRLLDLALNLFSIADVDGSGAVLGQAFGPVTSISRVESVPEELLAELAAASMGVGPGTSFVDKISMALAYYQAGDNQSACEILNAFQNQVAAQRDKTLTQAQADQFDADAAAIIEAIGCD